MQVLSELTIPYLKVGGKLLALKASNAPEELLEAKNALNLLLVRSKTISATPYRIEIRAISQW